jgi:hypothetical protein
LEAQAAARPESSGGIATDETEERQDHRQSADGLTIWPCSKGPPSNPGERERASPHG